jgi:hypothetical protein
VIFTIETSFSSEPNCSSSPSVDFYSTGKSAFIACSSMLKKNHFIFSSSM